MATRYIVDAEGRPVEAILDLDDLRQVLEAQRQVAEAVAMVERATRDLAEARRAGARDVERVAAQHRKNLQVIENAQRKFAAVMSGLGELADLEEDLEAIRAFDEDMERIERGEAGLIPWEESKRRRRQLR